MFKNYNAYNIIHKNGEVEKINAETMEKALAHMEIAETESPVARALLYISDMKTLVDDEVPEIVFSAVVDTASIAGGSIATPAEGTIHVGDEIQLKAIPARNYSFVSWSRNGVVISTEATLDYVMTPLVDGEDSAIFTATFKLSDINWTTAVSPAEATAQGCISFPTSGKSEANASAEFLAVAGEDYVFDHWERNGVTLSDNKLMQLEHVAPLANNETSAVYTAVFTAV